MAVTDYKFGDFELDSARFELRRLGRVVRLERIPMELLILLAEKNGSVVNREEISERLWGKYVFVDTQHGINTAVRKVRAALRDNAERPRFVQTVQGKGYRLLVESKNGNNLESNSFEGSKTNVVFAALPPAKSTAHKKPSWWPQVAVLVPILIVAVLLGFNRWLRERVFAKHQIGRIHSIAVLPLTNLSGDPTQEYYADGMTDELITELARNHSLRVVSRTSAMRYKGVSRPLAEIARELAVDGILEGSVSRLPDHVHMTVQLIYAPTDTHVWAASYDRGRQSEALSLPSEVSQTIAREISITASAATPRRYIDPEAHDEYLRGLYFWYGGASDQSRQHYEKAIRLQPDYAAAWAGLGNVYGGSAVAGETPPKDALAELLKDANKAVELDPSLPEAHNALSAFYFFNDWDWPRAELESLHTIELDPNFAEARHLHSYELKAMNRDDEALEEQKRATEIDPYARPWALGMAYIQRRQFDLAINELRLRADLNPGDGFLQFILGNACHYKGEEKQAADYYERAFAAWHEQESAEEIRRAFDRGGDRAVGEWFLSKELDRARDKYLSRFDLATDYARLRRKRDTLRLLDDALRERSPKLVFLQKEPAFDFLHSDEHYRAIVKKIGLLHRIRVHSLTFSAQLMFDGCTGFLSKMR